mmetsp:Transcript_55750/g.156451  ORF Transcript_55750/g.156451 Transcript_55750/m.156451 type:complete len:160 (+) Transcript_55750:184-663(+)
MDSTGPGFGHSLVQALFVGILVGLIIGLPGAIIVSCAQRLPWWPFGPDEKAPSLVKEDTIERTFPQRAQLLDLTPGQSQMCAICLQPVSQGEMLRELQCEHQFHALCIMAWLTHEPRTSVRCPLCRQEQVLLPEPADPRKCAGCGCAVIGRMQTGMISP